MLTGITLTVESGLQMGTEFHVSVPGFCTIGRSSDCDVAVIGDPDPSTVSRRHCRLDVTAFGVRIRDLGSRNGTFVNGVLIGKRQDPEPEDCDLWVNDGHRLTTGDVVSLGGVLMRVELEFSRPESLTVPFERMLNMDLVPMGA